MPPKVENKTQLPLIPGDDHIGATVHVAGWGRGKVTETKHGFVIVEKKRKASASSPASTMTSGFKLNRITILKAPERKPEITYLIGDTVTTDKALFMQELWKDIWKKRVARHAKILKLPEPPKVLALPEVAKTAPNVKDGVSGPDMKRALQRVGIQASKVIRSQKMQNGSYIYTCDFTGPNLAVEVPSAWYYWQVIRQRFPEFLLVKRNDQRADHRPGKPIIWACVKFRVKPEFEQAKAQAIPA